MTVTTQNPDAIRELKRQVRAVWASGDYDVVADGIWTAGAAVTKEAGVHPGDRVLDVACGTGNAAIQAAQAGGTVAGVDLTPELFAGARRRAAEAGVELELVEGDAEALPFDDESFDVVLSTFGVMFAPRHALAAAEMVRVLRPGGHIGLANWDPAGTVGDFFRILAGHMPPPPPVAEPPLLWGTEEHVRRLLDEHIDLTITRTHIPLTPDIEPAGAVDAYLSVFPPLVAARALLEPQGRWQAAEADIRPAIATFLADPPTYLVVGGTKRP